MTAAGADKGSWSWAVSTSVRARAGGSMFATCALKALISKAETSSGFDQMCRVLETQITQGPEGEPIEDNPTYVNLARAMHESMVEAAPTLWYEHAVSFAAQNDNWESE